MLSPTFQSSHLIFGLTLSLIAPGLAAVAPTKSEAAPAVPTTPAKLKPLSREERKYLALESLTNEFQACLAIARGLQNGQLTDQLDPANSFRFQCGKSLQNQLEDKVVIDDRRPNMNIHHRASMLDLYAALYVKCMKSAQDGKAKAVPTTEQPDCIDRLKFSLDNLDRTVPAVVKFNS